MKKVLFAIFAIVFCCIGMSFIPYEPLPVPSEEKIHWYTIQQATELCKTKPKKIFVDVYTSWCGWCKVMDANTFTHPVIAKIMNKYYYAVKLDAEMKDTVIYAGHTFINPDPSRRNSVHQFAAALLNNEMSYPSTVYIEETLEPITKIPGYRKPEELEPFLMFFAGNHHKTTTWEDFQKSFRGEVGVEVAPVTPPLKPH